MSSKTRTNESFLFNLLLLADFFFHNKIKYNKTKKNLNQKLKELSSLLKFKKSDLENYFSYLWERNIIYENKNYYFVNLSLMKKILKFGKSEGEKNIILQSNFEVLVKPGIGMRSLFFLVNFAEIQSRDVICKFLITDNSLHNAFTEKVLPKEIKSFLQEQAGLKNLPHNVEYFIDDIAKRSGEIEIGHSSGYLKAESHVLKSLLQDPEVKDDIIKAVSSSVALLNHDINIWDLYHYLKGRKYFPTVAEENVITDKDRLLIYMNKDEISDFLASLYTIKEINFEHQIRTDFNQIENLTSRIEKLIDKNIAARALEKSREYKQELKNSIKSYVLKSLKMLTPGSPNVVLNRIAVSYQESNPAIIKKDIITMVNFAFKHKMKIMVEYSQVNSKVQIMIEPKYLYNNKVLYYYNKETKQEESISLNKIIFTALL